LDPSGRWYLADNALGPGDLLLLTGRTLEHATAGIRRACVYRVVPVTPTAVNSFLGRCVPTSKGPSASVCIILQIRICTLILS
jgi:hypothetical protein